MTGRIFLLLIALLPATLGLQCHHCDEESHGGYNSGDCGRRWSQDHCRLFDVCIYLNKTVGDTTIVKRGCGAANTCQVQKPPGQFVQFSCNTCNTDLCNTGEGVSSDSSSSGTLWWPFTFVNTGPTQSSPRVTTYSQYKRQGIEYLRQVREIRKRLLDWEHEFDEWHHRFDHYEGSRPLPPPGLPNFC